MKFVQAQQQLYQTAQIITVQYLFLVRTNSASLSNLIVTPQIYKYISDYINVSLHTNHPVKYSK